MDKIAKALNVSTQTISTDLGNFQATGKLKHVKTATNKKGAGRPKNSKSKSRAAPTPHKKQDQVAALMDKGKTQAEIAGETGVGKRQVRHIIERVEIERKAKAEPIINREDLSLTAQQKFDTAIKQEKTRLAQSFEQRVSDEIKRRVDEFILPDWRQKIKEAKQIYDRRKGIMDKATFKLIWSALHPDSRKSITDKKLAEAFDAFSGMEKYLLNEKDSPEHRLAICRRDLAEGGTRCGPAVRRSHPDQMGCRKRKKHRRFRLTCVSPVYHKSLMPGGYSRAHA